MARTPPDPQARATAPPPSRRELPSGTVTFLMSDIEGSTRLFHRLGSDYVPLLAEHRILLREAVARHRGREVETEGDALLVAFGDAADAVAAAATTGVVVACDGGLDVRGLNLPSGG